MKWFKQLDQWTDRSPITAVLLIATICLLAATMALKFRDDAMMTANQAWYITGFLSGLVLGALITLIDIIRRRNR